MSPAAASDPGAGAAAPGLAAPAAGGTARRRRTQRLRQTARHVRWLLTVKQAETSHHTGAGMAHEASAEVRLQRLEDHLKAVQRQLAELVVTVDFLRSQLAAAAASGPATALSAGRGESLLGASPRAFSPSTAGIAAQPTDVKEEKEDYDQDELDTHEQRPRKVDEHEEPKSENVDEEAEADEGPLPVPWSWPTAPPTIVAAEHATTAAASGALLDPADRQQRWDKGGIKVKDYPPLSQYTLEEIRLRIDKLLQTKEVNEKNSRILGVYMRREAQLEQEATLG